MRIKNIKLDDYKRFTSLEISDIPQTTKLVVLVGPNGCGKSSVFDAFILKARTEYVNEQLTGNYEQYYEKRQQAEHTHDIANRISIDFHGNPPPSLKSAFQIRSAYRNEADFRVTRISTQHDRQEVPRLTRIIDIDAAVSQNYEYLTWKGLQDLYSTAKPETTFDEYRLEALGDMQDAMRDLFPNPELVLQDFGSMQSGTFRFRKGTVKDFHYKNLSSGEKAAFDILLDVFVKRHITPDAIFCIDEPELHVSTALQGKLLTAVLSLLPETAQLWIATHSLGVVKEATRIYEETPNEVVFLDFFNCGDLDDDVFLKNSKPSRSLWRNVFEVALNDLGSLTAPQQIVLCEGDPNHVDKGFDASCYNRLFASDFDDTLFISRGGEKQVIRQPELKMILKKIVTDVKIYLITTNHKQVLCYNGTDATT
ncbi:MAG: AAA family ATPase [Gammaproteobacteria bacterium]|nr:AAA family ATPase [Gammaproteobacteria bacterium]